MHILLLILTTVVAFVSSAVASPNGHGINGALSNAARQAAARRAPASENRAALPFARRQAGCDTQCSGDQATINSLTACAATDTACECKYLLALSSACFTCVLSSEGLTQASLSQVCAEISGGVPSGSVPSAANSGALPIISQGTCRYSYPSDGDVAGTNEMGQDCAASDTGCICYTASMLSPTCLSCILQSVGYSPAQFDGLCGSNFTSATSASALASASANSGPLSSGPTPTPAASPTTSPQLTSASQTAAGGASATSPAASPSASPAKSGATTLHGLISLGTILFGGLGALLVLRFA